MGLAIAVELTGSARHRFLEDLEKMGSSPAVASWERQLTPEQVRLMDLLARGATVTAACAQLSLSRRTASRRLAAVRERIGVASTAEAVVRWSALSDR